MSIFSRGGGGGGGGGGRGEMRRETLSVSFSPYLMSLCGWGGVGEWGEIEEVQLKRKEFAALGRIFSLYETGTLDVLSSHLL